MARKKAAKSSNSGQPRRARLPRPVEHRESYASIYPGEQIKLSPELVDVIQELENALELPVWLLVQDAIEARPLEHDSFNIIGDRVASAFFAARHHDLLQGQKIALLIDSNGGLARQTYALAMLLRRHCGGFVAVVPRHAKSAATLLTLGADQIILNDNAELGPLDVQIWDADREDVLSGLDEVEALERLMAFAMQVFDQMMLLVLQRTGKKSKNVMPVVTDFVTSLVQPMFSGIDVVRYTQMSRALKIAGEYATRLLSRDYGGVAKVIADKLVQDYPEHGFPVYRDELGEIGLDLPQVPSEIRAILERITQHLPDLNLVGRIVTAPAE